MAIVGVRATNGLFSLATGQPGVLQPQWAPAFGWMAGFGGTHFVPNEEAVCPPSSGLPTSRKPPWPP